jgi:hypothetical protein
MPTYLQRYNAGEREQVWDELLALGAAVRDEPLYSDALAVARETMTRARHNVELLVARLRQNGYEFADPGDEFIPAPSDAASRLDEIEAGVGLMPLSLRVWQELVGGIYLLGTHPDWARTGYANDDGYPIYTDPLCVDPLYEIERQVEDWGYLFEEGKFAFDIAPDLLYKANISGSGPIQISVPNPAIDGMVSDINYNMPFVAYLRNSFKWGGFPGFAEADEQMRDMKERAASRKLPSFYQVADIEGSYVPTKWLAQLTEGLLPI